MSRVAVRESILRWALERSNTSLVSLLPRFPKLNAWISGDVQPTLKQLKNFSAATTTPLGMLFLDSPPEESLPLPHYRTVSDRAVDRPSADLIDTVHFMQRRQDWMREYLLELGNPPLPFVGSAKITESAESVADRMRTVLGFQPMWAAQSPTWEVALRTFRQAMDRAGVLVCGNGVVGNNTHRVLNAYEFRGFVLVDDHAPLVFLNTADFKPAQMFTLAHEFAHVFYGTSAVFDLTQMQPADNAIEQACNNVAAEFLVPSDTLKSAWGSAGEGVENRIQTLASQFKVSRIVLARRALDTKLIARRAFVSYYNALVAFYVAREKSKGGNFYASQSIRIGKRFGEAVIYAVRSGRTLPTEGWSLTGLRGSTFDHYAACIEA